MNSSSRRVVVHNYVLNSVQFFVSLLTIATQKMNVWEWTAHPNLYVITPRLSGNCRLFFCTHTYIYILSMDITCYVGSLIKEIIKYYQFLYCSKWLLTYYIHMIWGTLFFLLDQEYRIAQSDF